MAVILGTIDPDTIIGTPGDDTITGLGGNDSIDGGEGIDTIDGGDGDDDIDGGQGNDVLQGGIGEDRLDGGIGNDTLLGSTGFDLEIDTLLGGIGDDTLTVYYGDVVDGGAGNDRVMLLALDDATQGVTFDGRALLETGLLAIGTGSIRGVEFLTTIRGSAFNDVLRPFQNNGLSMTLLGGGGDDIVVGTDANNQLAGGIGADMVTGGATTDLVSGFSLNQFETDSEVDILSAGGGDDVIFAGIGDIVDGGAHSSQDQLYLSLGGASAGVIANLAAIQATGTGMVGTTSIRDIEFLALYATDFADSFTMNGSNSVAFVVEVRGGAGGDTIVNNGSEGTTMLSALAENDIGAEIDTLVGGTGNDTFYAGYGDNVDGGGGSGTNTLQILDLQGAMSGVTANFNPVIIGGTITIGGGLIQNIDDIRQVFGSEFDDVLTASYPPFTSPVTALLGEGGNDVLTTGNGNDTLFGGAGSDTLDGGSGIDRLYSASATDDTGAEVDTITAGAGNDFVYVGFGDNADGGADSDGLQLHLGGATSGVTANFAAAITAGGLAIGGGVLRNFETLTQITGSAFNDNLTVGANVSSSILGGDGNDSLTGGGLNDALQGGNGADTLTGGDSADTLRSSFASGDLGTEIDTLLGGIGNDLLHIGFGDNANGGADTDSLIFDWRGATSGVIANLTAAFTGGTTTVGGGSITGFENLGLSEGSNFDDVITLAHLNLNATVNGNGGNDTINGTGLADRLNGNDGDDILNGNAGADTLVGGAGIDQLNGGADNDTITAGYGDSVDGGTGVNNLTFNWRDATAGVTANFGTLSSGGTIMIGGGTISAVRVIGANFGSDFADTIILSGVVGAQFNGFGGDDIVNGGTLADTIVGGDGGDMLSGGDSNDILTGSTAVQIDDGRVDTLDGGAGNDTLNAGYGDNVSGGNGDFDTLQYLVLSSASAGVTADLTALYGGGTLTIGGGIIQGIDILSFFFGTDFADDISLARLAVTATPRLALGGGDDRYTGDRFDVEVGGGIGDDVMNGGTGSEILNGEDGDDLLSGGGGNDQLTGGFGDDVLSGGAGGNILRGGEGIDTLDYSGATGAVTLNLQSQSATANGYGATDSYDASFENVLGGAFGDNLTANGFDNILSGNGGNDTLRGFSGNDILDGGSGNDSLIGGAGDDIYLVDSASDTITELVAEGTDLVRTALAAYTLAANVENLAYTGSDSFSGRGNSSGNAITGGIDDDRLVGKGGNDVLTGGDGHDTLSGDGGTDTLNGGDGNDILIVSDTLDTINGGAGIDTAVLVAEIVLNLSADVEWAENRSGGDVSVAMNDLDNLYGGGSDSDTVSGDDGNDVLLGYGGIDALYGELGNDRLDAGAGDDLLSGGDGNDVLEGGADSDTLEGGDDTDTLFGGDGSDSLSGGSGLDYLYGGDGADRFVFASGDASASLDADRIFDFDGAQGDRIDLSAIDAVGGTGPDDAFTFIDSAGFSNTAGELRAEVINGATYVMGDVDGDGIADFTIRVDGTAPLIEVDFLL